MISVFESSMLNKMLISPHLERQFKLQVPNVHRCRYLTVPSLSQVPAILNYFKNRERCEKIIWLGILPALEIFLCELHQSDYPLRTQGNSETCGVPFSVQLLLTWLISALLFKKCLLTIRLIYIYKLKDTPSPLSDTPRSQAQNMLAPAHCYLF